MALIKDKMSSNFNPIVEGVIKHLEPLQRKIKQLELIIKLYEDVGEYQRHYCDGKDCENILVFKGNDEYVIGNFIEDSSEFKKDFYYNKCDYCRKFYKPIYCNKCISKEDPNWYKTYILDPAFCAYCDECYDELYDEHGHLRGYGRGF